jgi:hypothetical protein
MPFTFTFALSQNQTEDEVGNVVFATASDLGKVFKG